VDDLSAAIKEATSLSDARLKEMGQAGRQLIEQRYSWKKSADLTLETYLWVLGRASIPDCVLKL
jgi:poly(glycerol-phosphate) alpha-glucosyltransferase